MCTPGTGSLRSRGAAFQAPASSGRKQRPTAVNVVPQGISVAVGSFQKLPNHEKEEQDAESAKKQNTPVRRIEPCPPFFV